MIVAEDQGHRIVAQGSTGRIIHRGRVGGVVGFCAAGWACVPCGVSGVAGCHSNTTPKLPPPLWHIKSTPLACTGHNSATPHHAPRGYNALLTSMEASFPWLKVLRSTEVPSLNHGLTSQRASCSLGTISRLANAKNLREQWNSVEDVGLPQISPCISTRIHVS